MQVGSFAEMPADLRTLSAARLNLDAIVEEQGAAVSRTDDERGKTPLYVFLASNFLKRATAGEGVGGSLQTLWGLALVELIYALLKGEVDDDEIRPKVVSLVRKTIS